MKGSILAAAISAAALAGLAGTPAWAQTAAAVQLSQTYDYNGQWAIDYPAGWVLDLTGFPVFASIPTAVGVLIQNDPLPVGTMVIGIIPPETNSLLGVTAGMPLDDVARRVATFYGASDVVATPFETTAGPAVSAPLPSIRMPAGSGLLVVDHDGTTFVFLVVVGDLAGATPLLQAMLATLR